MNNSALSKFWASFATFADPDYPDMPDPVRKSKINIFLAVVLATAFFMWAYAVVADTYLLHPTMRYMGYVYAALHLSSILVLRFTKSLTVATWAILIPGWLFQTHFSALTGGFFTITIVWVGILPIIAGVATNIKHTLIWSFIATMTIIVFMLAQSQNLFPPSILNPEANWLIQAMLTIGLITLISGFTIFILLLDKKATDQQRQKALSKATMLQTLSHDIANPLTVISVLLDIKSADELQLDRDKTKLLRNNTKKIRQIINSVRLIESVESGKGNLELSDLDLSECLKVAAGTVERHLKAKKNHAGVRITSPAKSPWP
jgi:signal transduction histidine kinase